jgi:hypothetical protein
MQQPAAVLSLVLTGVIYSIGSLKADGRSNVTSGFTDTRENARSALEASGCHCISCTEENASVEAPTWSTYAYFGISAVFITASLAVYGLLWVVAHCQTVRTDTTEKLTGAAGTKQSLIVRGYRFAHVKVFGSLLTMDSKRTRRLSEYWVTECQLLDCFWSCSRYERPRRRLSLRLLRLMSSLLVTASISFFFGTLEFDTTVCSTFVDGNLCYPSLSAAGRSLTEAVVADSVASATVMATSDSSTMATAVGGPGRTTTPIIKSCSSQANSRVSLRPIIGSISKVSSAIAFVVTQCVKFVGSYAQNLGTPDSKLDWCAHVLWLLVAAAAIPVSAVLSTRLLSDGSYTYKSEKLRMRIILSVTLSAWLQVQLADIFKVPLVYLSKKVGHMMLPSPEAVATSHALQPRRPRELDCLGGQHSLESR